MTPTDAGALIALINRADRVHAACTAAMRHLPKPLVTTWPCVTEAMHLLGKAGGYTFQEKLWRLVEVSPISVYDLSASESARMRVLMGQYNTTPKDLADASLVAMAETIDARRVFTVDSDFYIYRLADGRALRLVP